jgi:hypothetical protein
MGLLKLASDYWPSAKPSVGIGAATGRS